MSRNRKKLQQLMELEGYSGRHEQWLWDNLTKALVEGICTARDCDYTTQVEVDQTKGWCEVCQRKTVVSGQSLMGY